MLTARVDAVSLPACRLVGQTIFLGPEQWDLMASLRISANDKQRGISSVGRAFGWQPKGRRFEPCILHFLRPLKRPSFLSGQASYF